MGFVGKVKRFARGKGRFLPSAAGWRLAEKVRHKFEGNTTLGRTIRNFYNPQMTSALGVGGTYGATGSIVGRY